MLDKIYHKCFSYFSSCRLNEEPIGFNDQLTRLFANFFENFRLFQEKDISGIFLKVYFITILFPLKIFHQKSDFLQ